MKIAQFLDEPSRVQFLGFADYDGVVVIPAEVLPDVIRLADEKVTRENHTREELTSGAYLRDVYEKYGVL